MEAAMRKIQKYDSSTIIPLFTQPRAAVVVVNLFGHRACNQCQDQTTEQWLARQQRKLLPVN
jgi:hypothetical protein